MVNPGGTGRPRFVISARFAPFPPSRSFWSLLPSPNEYTSLVMRPRGRGRRSGQKQSGAGPARAPPPPLWPRGRTAARPDDADDAHRAPILDSFQNRRDTAARVRADRTPTG